MIRARLLLPLGLSVFALGYGMASLFSVKAEEQAVITRGETVLRIVGPGIQAHMPIIEQVHIYPVLLERRTVVDGAFTLATCPAEVSVIYRVGDVVAFHEGGGTDTGYPASQSVVQGVLSRVPRDSADPVGDARATLTETLRPFGDPAFHLNQVVVDIGDCGPQPPRIETVSVPLPAPATDRLVGTNRSRPVDVNVMTADRVRIEILGAAASYDVTDTNRFASCFGPGTRGEEVAADRLSHLVAYALRSEAVELPLEGFGMAMADRMANVTSFPGDISSTCGLTVRGIDLSQVQLTRLREVNCDETPEADACTPPASLRPLQP